MTRPTPRSLRRAWFPPIEQAPPAGAPPRRRAALPLMALLAGYLLFAHGCHGDEDNELFARLSLRAAKAAP